MQEIKRKNDAKEEYQENQKRLGEIDKTLNDILKKVQGDEKKALEKIKERLQSVDFLNRGVIDCKDWMDFYQKAYQQECEFSKCTNKLEGLLGFYLEQVKEREKLKPCLFESLAQKRARNQHEELWKELNLLKKIEAFITEWCKNKKNLEDNDNMPVIYKNLLNAFNATINDIKELEQNFNSLREESSARYDEMLSALKELKKELESNQCKVCDTEASVEEFEKIKKAFVELRDKYHDSQNYQREFNEALAKLKKQLKRLYENGSTGRVVKTQIAVFEEFPEINKDNLLKRECDNLTQMKYYTRSRILLKEFTNRVIKDYKERIIGKPETLEEKEETEELRRQVESIEQEVSALEASLEEAELDVENVADEKIYELEIELEEKKKERDRRKAAFKGYRELVKKRTGGLDDQIQEEYLKAEKTFIVVATSLLNLRASSLLTTVERLVSLDAANIKDVFARYMRAVENGNKDEAESIAYAYKQYYREIQKIKIGPDITEPVTEPNNSNETSAEEEAKRAHMEEIRKRREQKRKEAAQKTATEPETKTEDENSQETDSDSNKDEEMKKREERIRREAEKE